MALCSLLSCILLGAHISLLYKNKLGENIENEKGFYHSQPGATSKFVQLYKAPHSPCHIPCYASRPCLSIVVPCFQSLNNIHQDYCMLNQLHFFLHFHLTSKLKVMVHCYSATLPSFKIDFLFWIQLIRLCKYSDCFKISN